jgi:hypothetical protein
MGPDPRPVRRAGGNYRTLKFGGIDIRLPDGASAPIDDVEVDVGSAADGSRSRIVRL